MQGEFDILTSEHTEELFLKSRQTHYEHGERAGSFCVLSIETSTAAAIGDSEGNIITHQQGIIDQFRSFYEALYTSEVDDRANRKVFQQLRVAILRPFRNIRFRR